MARKKKRSDQLVKADVRLAAVKAIAVDLDLGNGITASVYETLITDTRQAMAAYNSLLSTLDDTLNKFKELEKSLADMSERVLSGIASKYGKYSSEYEMAGGSRRSERRRSRQYLISEPVPQPIPVD